MIEQRSEEELGDVEVLWMALGALGLWRRAEAVLSASPKLAIPEAWQRTEDPVLLAMLGLVSLGGTVERIVGELPGRARAEEERLPAVAMSLREVLR